jgi:hypothetical protein
MAASRFLSEGYQVYWPTLAHEVDFVIEKGGKLSRVQVKTAGYSKAGRISYLQCRIIKTRSKKASGFSPASFYDLLFVHAPGVGDWLIPAPVIDTTNLCLASFPDVKNRERRWDKYKVQSGLQAP